MTQITSFRDVIELWPSREAMASDIGARPSAVSKWWQRDSLPAEWWALVLGTNVSTENGLKAEMLMMLASREQLEART